MSLHKKGKPLATKYLTTGCGIGTPYGHSFIKEQRNKVKTTSKHKYRYVRRFGVTMSGDGSGFVFKRQIFDRSQNRYMEFLVDLQTGEILRNVDEPLSEHRGRGSAKIRKGKTPSQRPTDTVQGNPPDASREKG